MRAACFAPSFLLKRGALEWGCLQIGSSHFNKKILTLIGRLCSKSNYKRENAQFVAGSCGGFLNVCCSSVPTGPSGSGGGPSITSSVETLPQTVVSTSSPSSTGEGAFRYSHWPIFLPTLFLVLRHCLASSSTSHQGGPFSYLPHTKAYS